MLLFYFLLSRSCTVVFLMIADPEKCRLGLPSAFPCASTLASEIFLDMLLLECAVGK